MITAALLLLNLCLDICLNAYVLVFLIDSHASWRDKFVVCLWFWACTPKHNTPRGVHFTRASSAGQKAARRERRPPHVVVPRVRALLFHHSPCIYNISLKKPMRRRPAEHLDPPVTSCVQNICTITIRCSFSCMPITIRARAPKVIARRRAWNNNNWFIVFAPGNNEMTRANV